MKTTIKSLIVSCVLSVWISGAVIAQEKPAFMTVTTIHWNQDYENFSMDEWKAVEKEYFDKVTMKNEFIMHSSVMMHYFTADNSELVLLNGYSSWENIMKAGERSAELEKAAWPDEVAREAFLKKQSAYYTHMHSDEIYSTLDGAKLMAGKPTEQTICYVRVSHLAFPEGGTTEEAQALRKEYNDNVIAKNNLIKAYYPSRHAWGSDSREFVEAFVFESLADLEKSAEENQKLVKAHWPDEAQRDAFFDKLDKYFTGWHGDYIYRDVPELTK